MEKHLKYVLKIHFYLYTPTKLQGFDLFFLQNISCCDNIKLRVCVGLCFFVVVVDVVCFCFFEGLAGTNLKFLSYFVQTINCRDEGENLVIDIQGMLP